MDLRDGSIPACAGKPSCSIRPISGARVYPRVCGEAPCCFRDPAPTTGLSPRVRGSPRRWAGPGGRCGSIPACAGKPHREERLAYGFRVYPRVCGEADTCESNRRNAMGLSPRVRGSPVGVNRRTIMPGSIPACAGKPSPLCLLVLDNRVYPRVCGEAGQGSDWNGPRRGLSRVCGEAMDARSIASVVPGLSPRVRGSRYRCDRSGSRGGSIPACAGKPRVILMRRGRYRVYPRVCGEAASACMIARPSAGLSPRVRGSRLRGGWSYRPERSIPACAGKPEYEPSSGITTRVYPRVCGEALRDALFLELGEGLSPRVRGSHEHGAFTQGTVGSIPACAGKPRSARPWRRGSGVYPRVCGEALTVTWAPVRWYGLSPRVRGSR